MVQCAKCFFREVRYRGVFYSICMVKGREVKKDEESNCRFYKRDPTIVIEGLEVK